MYPTESLLGVLFNTLSSFTHLLKNHHPLHKLYNTVQNLRSSPLPQVADQRALDTRIDAISAAEIAAKVRGNEIILHERTYSGKSVVECIIMNYSVLFFGWGGGGGSLIHLRIYIIHACSAHTERERHTHRETHAYIHTHTSFTDDRAVAILFKCCHLCFVFQLVFV